MANALTKTKNVQYIPGHPSVPYDAGQPWLPERTVWEKQKVCGWHYWSGLTINRDLVKFEWVYMNRRWQAVPTVPFYTTWESASYYCTMEQVPVTVPGQQYIPPTAPQDAKLASVVADMNLGWNAGARSKGFISADGRFDVIPETSIIGAVVGMNDVDLDAGYMNIEFAWYFSHGIARIIESGQQVFYSGAYEQDDWFSIERTNGAVSYLKDGMPVYTSAKTSSGPVFMDVSLYSGDDSIRDPFIDSYESSWTALCALYSNCGNNPINQSYANLLPLVGSSGVLSRSGGSLAPLTGVSSDRPHGESSASISPLEVFCSGGMLMPSYSICNAALLYLTVGAWGTTGTIGGSNASLSPLDSLSSGDDVLSTEVGALLGDGYAEFKAPANLANVVAGLATVSVVTSVTQITHGLLFNGGSASVMEAGITRLSLGAYLGSDTWRISRIGGQVKYFKNGVLRYTSTVPSIGVVYLSDIGI